MRSLLIVAGLLLAGIAHAETEAATGTVVPLPSRSRPGHLGGDGPQFLLYLRADGVLGQDGRDALSAAIAALARVPGAGVDIYIDPADRDASAFAETLAKPPDETSRRALLVALAREDLPRASPSTALRFRRSYALTMLQHAGASLTASPAVNAMLQRPPGVPFAQRPFFALGDRKLDTASVDALADANVWHTPERARPELERALAAGSPLAESVLRICYALPLTDASRDVLTEALRLYDLGRARLRLELAAPEAGSAVHEGERALRRAFDRADALDRVRLVRALLQARLPETEAAAVRLIQSAGVDPTPLLDGGDAASARGAPVVLDPSVPISVVMNTIPVSVSDLRMAARTPSLSLRQRIARDGVGRAHRP
jgi:hypothetical protein